MKTAATPQKKVGFLVCGTQKGGTTALNAYLSAHPHVCMARHKEVHFFDNEKYFRDGPPNYRLYHSFFKPGPGHKILGEATPIYMYWHDAPRRIWEYNPDIKLIILLRNPVKRAYSHWNMERDRKKESLSFIDAVTQEAERCRTSLPMQHRVFSYIDRGFYMCQLRRIWSFLPKEQVLVFKNETLMNNPQSVMDQLCAFLKIGSLKIQATEIRHSIEYEEPMSSHAKSLLVGLYENEIREIERVLNWDCSDWLV